MIDDLYAVKEKFQEWYTKHQVEYTYPTIEWASPSEFVVSGDKRSTWNNLQKNPNHPVIDLSLQVDFILVDTRPGAQTWFSDFILLYQPGMTKLAEKRPLSEEEWRRIEHLSEDRESISDTLFRMGNNICLKPKPQLRGGSRLEDFTAHIAIADDEDAQDVRTEQRIVEPPMDQFRELDPNRGEHPPVQPDLWRVDDAPEWEDDEMQDDKLYLEYRDTPME